MSRLIPVILSGGAGTRLWPVSRASFPKPFMRVDGRTLAARTLERAKHVSGGAPVITVTARDHYFLTRDEYAAAGHAGEPFLLEPCARNTAPAVAVAASYARARYGDDAQLLVLPADHLIEDLDAFADAVAEARAVADHGYLVTFGIAPSRPDTGFGYIRRGADIQGTGGARVEAFVEKPDRKTAEGYIAAGGYTWNSGMFLFRADALVEAMDEVALDIREAAERVLRASDLEADPVELDRAEFERMPDISFDYAVMEKAAKRAVVSGDFDWNDIGSWQAVSDLAQADERGNRTEGPVLLVDADNCFVQSESRLIAAVGVSNLVVVDAGDALLVASRERAQDVKKVVSELKSRNHRAATEHRLARHPWGSSEVLEQGPGHRVSRLTVHPGGSISARTAGATRWIVIGGQANVTVDGSERRAGNGETLEIPADTEYELHNPGAEDLQMIEIQNGAHLDATNTRPT